MDKQAIRRFLESMGAGVVVKHIRTRNKPVYKFQPQYVPISGTQRHCYIHPRNQATHLELNTYDKSYRRPVCIGCVDQAA